MFDSPRRRVTIGFILIAASLVLVGAPTEPAAAAGPGCFTISVTNNERMAVPAIGEASGLVLSRQMPGVMWTHNDNDATASNPENNRIYAVNEQGELLATVQFTMSSGLNIVPGPKFVELEDISYGPGPNGDPNYLYLADTGDNNPKRNYASVYRFREPTFQPNPANPITINIAESQLDATRFKYQSFFNPAEVKPRNVEAIFIDPPTGNLFLFEKGLHAIDANGDLADSSGLPRQYAFVYRVNRKNLFPTNPATVRLATIESYVKAQFAESTGGITGADISADGTIIAVKNTLETFYWRRSPNESILNTFNADHAAPCLAPTGMRGEALAIGPTSDRMVMIREGNISPIWQAVFTNQTHQCLGRPATILGTAGDDVITGTGGNDVIVTFGGDDVVDAKGGKDRIDGGWGADVLIGDSGPDIIWGRDGRDVVAGKAGADEILGGDDKDILSGGSGADVIKGGNGADSIAGKRDDDALTGGKGRDDCDGGPGTDTASSCEKISAVP